MYPIRVARLWIGLALLLGATSGTSFGQESWDAIYVGGVKVGNMHVRVEPVKDKKNQSLVRVRVDWNITFARGQNQVSMKLMYGTIEKPDGEILRLDTQRFAAQDKFRSYGDVINGEMELKIEANGQQEKLKIPWDKDVRGPYAAELSLARSPIKAGEVRDLKTFVPDLNKICTTNLVAKDFEDVPLGPKGEKRKLMRVELITKDEAGKPIPSMASTLWIDDHGQILKSHSDMLGGMDVYRTNAAGAVLNAGGPKFDLLKNFIVKVPRPIANSEKTRNITYKIQMEADDPREVFPVDRRQTIAPGDDKKAIVLNVATAGPNEGAAEPAPTAEYLQPNPLVNSEDARVMRHAKAAVGGETDPWRKAQAIESWVANNMVEQNFSVAFANAGEVARNLKGDCSEHSVLVAAMCRAEGVPARCVIGLVYAPSLGGFGPHMWNEAYVNGRWVAIDAAFEQSAVDATHIKLSTSSLDGVAALEAFLPVLRVFDKIKIEPVEIR